MPIYHKHSRLCITCPKCSWVKKSKQKGHSDCLFPAPDLLGYSQCPKCQHDHLELISISDESILDKIFRSISK